MSASDPKKLIAKADKLTKLSLTRWSADWKQATELYEQAAIGFRRARDNDNAKEAFEKASKGQEMLASYHIPPLFFIIHNFPSNNSQYVSLVILYTFVSDSPWDAAKHMDSAAALAKELSNWTEVADFYRRASELYMECSRPQPASDALGKGARALADSSPDEAIQMYIDACSILEEDGKEQMAFDLYRDAASLYVKLENDMSAATTALTTDSDDRSAYTARAGSDNALPDPKLTDPKPPDPKPPDLRSYASVLKSARETAIFGARGVRRVPEPRFAPIPLAPRQYGSVEGKFEIPFNSAEFEAGEHCFRHSLIAKFMIGRPSIAEIRRVFQANWLIKGRGTICDIWDGRHLLIILDSEEDAVTALTSQMRRIQQTSFRLFRFSSDYNPRREATVTTKWIRLPGLPAPFWHKSYIGAIVNSFGQFLDTDERTQACISMRYARACIEIDVTKPLPDVVRIALPGNKSFWQRIEFEGNMSYCSYCRKHGHDFIKCRKKKPTRMYEGMTQRDGEGFKHVPGSQIAGLQFVAASDCGPDNLLKVMVHQEIDRVSKGIKMHKGADDGVELDYAFPKNAESMSNEVGITESGLKIDEEVYTEGVVTGNVALHKEMHETPASETDVVIDASPDRAATSDDSVVTITPNGDDGKRKKLASMDSDGKRKTLSFHMKKKASIKLHCKCKAIVNGESGTISLIGNVCSKDDPTPNSCRADTIRVTCSQESTRNKQPSYPPRSPVGQKDNSPAQVLTQACYHRKYIILSGNVGVRGHLHARDSVKKKDMNLSPKKRDFKYVYARKKTFKDHVAEVAVGKEKVTFASIYTDRDTNFSFPIRDSKGQ